MRYILLFMGLCWLTACDILRPWLSPDQESARFDKDGDGIRVDGGDCDDTDPEVGILVWYIDEDDDSYGAGGGIQQCDAPDTNYVTRNSDCDDLNAGINPGRDEVCDGIDNDCDGLLDEADNSVIDATPYYTDADGDSYGDPDTREAYCEAPTGKVLDNTDCDDTDANVNPGEIEQCQDGVDNNCNGEVDTDAQEVTWYYDNDNDGYGVESPTTSSCLQPEGFTDNTDDCDDNNEYVNPAADEICNNGMDDNCDNSVNECLLQETLAYTDADATLSAVTGNGYYSYMLKIAGDMNEDGNVDLLVTSPWKDTAFLHLGPFSGQMDTDSAITISGPSGSFNGFAATAGQDITGDGYDDLVIASPFGSENGSESGTIWILEGPVTSGPVTLSESAIPLYGEADSGTGSSISCLGDLNDDGIADLVIGASHNDETFTDAGAAHVLYGPVSGQQNLTEIVLYGLNQDDNAGATVQIIGDINADGYDELVVGAPKGDNESTSNTGHVYILNGPVSSNDSLESTDLTLKGETSGAEIGTSLLGNLDINDDGYGDLIIGAPLDNSTATKAGIVHIVYGPGTNSSLSDSPSITGSEGIQLGASLGAGCDVDGDGIDDLLIGAPTYGSDNSKAGSAHLFYGPVTSSLDVADADVFIEGLDGSNFGSGMTGATDLNNDDLCDLVIGAYVADTTVERAGAVYLFNGLGY